MFQIETSYKFKDEKDIYNYLQKHLFKKYYKIYSIILRGLPDYIVSEIDHSNLKPGFYEVKFEDRPLKKYQKIVLTELKKIGKVYIVRGYRDGKIRINEF